MTSPSSPLLCLDQNITVRTVNSPSHKLRKGQAYHLDLCALGVLTLFASLTGLPWMCSATVQSLNHVRAMTVYRKIKPKDGPELEVPDYVVETRVMPPYCAPPSLSRHSRSCPCLSSRGSSST
jgi:HCO3- transporter family